MNERPTSTSSTSMPSSGTRTLQQSPSAATARANAELARARAEVAKLEQQAGSPPPPPDAPSVPGVAAQGGQHTSVTTSPDGRTTTIDENGEITRIVTDENGQVTITKGDNTTTLSGPGAEAIERLAQQQAHTAVAPFEPPFPGNRQDIPDEVIPLVGTIFGLVAATIVLFPITRAFGRRMDRKSAAPAPGPDMGVRFDRIEQAIETMAIEIERVSEAQRYSAKLLTERLPEAPRAGLARGVAAEQSR